MKISERKRAAREFIDRCPIEEMKIQQSTYRLKFQ